MLVCSACNGSWLRRVKPIYDGLKSQGMVQYHCPRACCKFSRFNGPKMEVRKRDFGLAYKASNAHERNEAPPWKVRIS